MTRKHLLNKIAKLTQSKWKRKGLLRDENKTVYTCDDQKICEEIYFPLHKYLFFLNTRVEESLPNGQRLSNFVANYVRTYFIGKYFLRVEYRYNDVYHDLLLYKIE